MSSAWMAGIHLLGLSSVSSIETLDCARRSIFLIMQTEKSFAFISDVLDVQIQLPAQLTPTLAISRATENQTMRIKDVLNRLGGFVPRNYSFEYENISVPVGSSEQAIPLPPDQWRYYGISFQGMHAEADADKIFRLAQLCEPQIDCQFTLFDFSIDGKETGAGTKWNGSPHPHGVYTAGVVVAKKLDAAFITSITACLDRFGKLDSTKHEGIHRAIDLFYLSKRVEDQNFLAMAYFAVIEMLITHQPGDKEIGDSIRHQLLTKIPLLSARMAQPITYESFQGASSKQVWDALYSYRSRVAHGGKINFLGELKILGSPMAATSFLRQTTRRLLRAALDEPDLVTDLKRV